MCHHRILHRRFGTLVLWTWLLMRRRGFDLDSTFLKLQNELEIIIMLWLEVVGTLCDFTQIRFLFSSKITFSLARELRDTITLLLCYVRSVCTLMPQVCRLRSLTTETFIKFGVEDCLLKARACKVTLCWKRLIHSMYRMCTTSCQTNWRALFFTLNLFLKWFTVMILIFSRWGF